MDRVFLDANVLFSAAWRKDADLLRLWRLDEVVLVTSSYALEEARRNCVSDEHRTRLEALTPALEIVAHRSRHTDLAAGLELPDDDRPILGAAIDAGASHLLSGDRRAFGDLYGSTIEGVMGLRPGEYLRRRGGTGALS